MPSPELGDIFNHRCGFGDQSAAASSVVPLAVLSRQFIGKNLRYAWPENAFQSRLHDKQFPRMDYPNGLPWLSLVLTLGVANFRPQRMEWQGLRGNPVRLSPLGPNSPTGDHSSRQSDAAKSR
jgi:hypothetical protein